jgi:hypothetical protein
MSPGATSIDDEIIQSSFCAGGLSCPRTYSASKGIKPGLTSVPAKFQAGSRRKGAGYLRTSKTVVGNGNLGTAPCMYHHWVAFLHVAAARLLDRVFLRRRQVSAPVCRIRCARCTWPRCPDSGEGERQKNRERVCSGGGK